MPSNDVKKTVLLTGATSFLLLLHLTKNHSYNSLQHFLYRKLEWVGLI